MFDRSRRNRFDALAIAGALLYWLVVGVDSPGGVDGVQRADFGISAVVGTVVSILSGLFGLFRGKQDTGSKLAFEGIRATVTEMGKSFLSSIVDVAGKVAAIVGTFIRFVQRTFEKLYDMLAKVVTRVARILDRIFGPLIRFLDKIRAHLKKFYDKVLRPIIDTIEMVRSFLRLLSFFGLDWSKKLDAELGKLEQYILAPYEFLVSKLNEVMNWINRIVTLDGLLQRVTLLGSLIRDVKLTNTLWWASNHRTLSGAAAGVYNQVPGPRDIAEASAEAEAYIVHHQGPDRGRIDEHVQDLRIRLEGLRFF